MEEENRSQSVLRKYLALFFLTLLGYLLEVCVAPLIQVGDVAPNFLFPVIAIVTVAYGKLRSFWVSCVYSFLMEVMLPAFSFFHLALYLLIPLLTGFFFADKSHQKIEYERSLSRQKNRGPMPLLRTLGDTLVNIFIFEGFNVLYITISGNPIMLSHIRRAFLSVLLTGLVALILMLPARRFIFGHWDKLGLRRTHKMPPKKSERSVWTWS